MALLVLGGWVAAWAQSGAARSESGEIRIGLPAEAPPVVGVTIGEGGVTLDLPRGASFPLDFEEASSGLVRSADTGSLPDGRVRLTLLVGSGLLDGIRYEPSSVVLRFVRRSSPGSAANASADVYRVGVDDRLLVSINGDPLMTQELVVSAAGTIAAPLVGETRAAGLTVDQLSANLTNLLARDYLTDPRVEIQVREYRSQWVMVTGAIRTPGRVPLKGSTRLKDVVAEAGGFTDEAGTDIVVSRSTGPGGAEQQVRVDRDAFESGAANPPLSSGDIVNVSRAAYVYVNGEVKLTGRWKLEKGMTLLKAIILAGGPTEWANLKNVQLSREGAPEPLVFNLKDLYDKKAEDPELRPGDIVIVRRRFL